MKRLAAFTLAFCLVAGQALAAPAVNSLVFAANTTSQTATTTGAVTGTMAGSGNTIVVAISWVNVNTTFTCSDTKSNTYVSGTKAVGTNTYFGYCYAQNATNLVSGTDTITVTWGSAVTGKSVNAAWVSGVATSGGAFAQGTGTTGASTTPSITTSSIPTGYLVFAGNCINSALSGDAYTEDSANAAWNLYNYTWASQANTRAAYFVASGTGALTHAPTLGVSRTWVSQWIAFAPSSASGHTLLLTGVGE